MNEKFEPATLSDLTDKDDKLIVFCRDCGHYAYLLPKNLKLPPHQPIPSLGGKFRCSKCNGKNTYAEPRYAAQFIRSDHPPGKGWIMPPE